MIKMKCKTHDDTTTHQKKISSVSKKRQSVDQRNTNEKEVKNFLYKILLFLIFTQKNKNKEEE